MTSTLINVAETFGLTDDQTLAGVSPVTRRNYSPRRRQAIVEAANLWKRVFDGDIRAAVQVREALSTSDLFVSATGDVLDRELLQAYSDITAEWQKFASRSLVRNFKPKKLVDLMGGRTKLDAVPELTAYPGAKHDTREFSIQVAKYGRQFGFSWEALVNDDLDELQQIPGTFGQAAALTETANALAIIADLSTGAPNTAYFKDYSAIAGYGTLNTTPGTAALTAASLQTAIEAIGQRTDNDGELVPPPPLTLVVGPALAFTAESILNVVEVRTQNGTGSGSTITVAANPLRGKVALQVVSSLPGSAWFVVPTPNQGRPAVVSAFLRGFETPDIRQKNGAGAGVSPDSGDFDDDSVRYRVRHVHGAAGADPIHTYASTGAS
jgi:hypothetical protein